MNDVAISVRHVVKEYDVYSRPLDVALEVLSRKPRHTKFRALDDISFDVPRGQVLGIIGPNGAGKSTLLKIITGVLDATAGEVSINGKVTAILELGLGFNPEYTGRENIFLSGLLYGMDRAEVTRKLDSIIEFSGLGDFIERPVKTYSSGMHSRLAFSIATAVDPDILIIDEALAAGDSAFVQKCLRRIRELCSSGHTVLLVSHGTGLLAQLCEKVIWIDHGKLRLEGPAIQVVQAYDLAAHQAADSEGWIEKIDDELDQPQEKTGAPSHIETPPDADTGLLATEDRGRELAKQVFRRGPVFISSVELIDDEESLTNRLTMLKPFKIRIHYRVEGNIPSDSLGIALAVNNKIDLSPVAQYMTQNIRPTETRETYDYAIDRIVPRQNGTIDIEFDYVPFRKGEYLLSIGLLPNLPACWQFYEYRHFYYTFSVDDAGMDVGAPVVLAAKLVHLPEEQIAEVVEEPKPIVPEGTLRQEIEEICRARGGYPKKWHKHTACPACARSALVPSFKKYDFTHSRCKECGFICVNPYPPDDVLNALYKGKYYTNVRRFFELPLLKEGGAGTPFSAPADAMQYMIDRATGNRKTGKWLDVGGGLGAFANLVKSQRPGWDVQLNELNQISTEIARELFDFKVVSSGAEDLVKKKTRYDVISSVAVLEHIPNPVAFLTAYAQLLKPGGWLVTAIPHFSSLNAAISKGSSANVVPPYHTSLFGESALRALLTRVDELETVDIQQFGGAAFELIHHVAFGDNWDISIPSEADPTPRSIQIKPYDDESAIAISALNEAGIKMGDFFARHDGRTMLVSFCRKKAAASN